MKLIISIIFLFCFTQFVSSQKSQKSSFFYANTSLGNVLTDIEKQFKVKYSYVDSIISGKKISLPKEIYSIDEMNFELERQTTLKIIKIDNRFYSILKEENQLEPKVYVLNDVLVEGFLAKGITKTLQNVIVYPQKVQTLPGVTDADVLLTLQQLPGVKSPNETSSGLHVRGGTSDQNLILWDGIRLYHPGHLFGMISVINPNIEQTVNYYNKAVNSKFGERISSIIDIRTTDEISSKTKVNAGVNLLNVDAYIQTPLIKNKLGLQFSFRKSITEWFQSPTFNQLSQKVFQNTNFRDFGKQNQFRFQDYTVKLNFKPTEKANLSLTGMWIDNDLYFKSKADDLSINNQTMSISNYGLSLNWTQNYSAKFKQKVLLFFSAYDFDYQKKRTFTDVSFEGYKKLNRVVDSGAEFNFSFAVSEKLNFDFGYQLYGNDISHLFNSFNQNVGAVLDLSHNYNITHIGYSFLKYSLEKWNFQTGVRYNFYTQLQSNSFEPRVLVQRHLSDTFVWQLSYEKKSQISSQIRENFANDLSLENYVWVLAKKNEYPIQRANQYATGLIYKNKSWLFDIEGYYKTINGITSFTFDFQNQYDLNINNGNGFTKGIDILIQRTAATWRAWATYTFQDSQNKFDNINQNQYFKINSNIKHSLNISLYKKWKAYNLALGWFWHTGKPYSLLDSSKQIVSYNSQSLADYHRLDVSGFYQFTNKKAWTYKIGFSIYNLYNRQEILSRELERIFLDVTDFITSKYTVQDYYSLGITPNIFLRVSL